MQVVVYGKKECDLCESAQRKLRHLLDQWGMLDRIPIVFMDMGSVDGAAEGDFFDVFEIPTVTIVQGKTMLARWDGQAPHSEELAAIVCKDSKPVQVPVAEIAYQVPVPAV